MNSKLITLLLLTFSLSSFAKINIITTTTDLKWMAQKIGGNKVQVESLLDGSEDPHYIDAMPHFISKTANADIFCLVGLDLEIGWVPKVLTKSGNKQVQQGGKGYCETGKTVKAIDIPTGKIDRSQGDVHPSGNPHYHLSPQAFLQGAQTVLDTLIAVDLNNAQFYMKNFDRLKNEMEKLQKEVQQILKPIKGKSIIEYHKEFSYFLNEFELKNIGAIESVPGVPPSAGRLARVAIKANNLNASLALAAPTSPKRLTDKFQAMSKIPVLRNPISILTTGFPKTYPELIKELAKNIVKTAKK